METNSVRETSDWWARPPLRHLMVVGPNSHRRPNVTKTLGTVVNRRKKRNKVLAEKTSFQNLSVDVIYWCMAENKFVFSTSYISPTPNRINGWNDLVDLNKRGRCSSNLLQWKKQCSASSTSSPQAHAYLIHFEPNQSSRVGKIWKINKGN